MKKWDVVLCAAVMAAFVSGCSDRDGRIYPGNTGLVINELKVNVPEDEHRKQFIELKGKASETLKHVYLVVLDGDENGDEEKPFEDWGHVDYVRPLSGVKVGKNGLVLIKNPGEYNDEADPETTLIHDETIRNYDEDEDGEAFKDGILEHDAVTFLLIQSDRPVARGTDLDSDNDGRLELPEGAVMLDSVGWEAGGQTYSEAVLVQSASDPDAASRFYGNTDPESREAWANGDLYEYPDKGGEELADGVLYDTLQASANLPPGAAVTPGASNFRRAPFVLLNEIMTTGDRYIELLSNAAQDMSHIHLVVLTPEAMGVPDLALDLSRVSARETGITLIQNGHSAIFPGSAVSSMTADLSSLTSSPRAVLLIYSPGRSITAATDLDTDNDGDLDLPADAVLLDGFGWGEPSYSDIAVNESYAIKAATRYKDNKMVTLNAWTFGELDGLTYLADRSKNKPEGGSLTPAGTNFPETAAMLVKPVFETARTTMENPDADDVAFWIHPTDSSKSLVIATQKEAGYSIYSVNGETLADANPGNIRFNNVDVMYGFDLNGISVDMAVFTDRMTNRFAIYRIQETAPYIVDITDSGSDELFDAEKPGEDTAYGEGVYKSPVSGKFYAFATQNDTWNCAQFELMARPDQTVGWTRVRRITLEAGDDDEYAEGFVIDQEYGKAYVAQEGVGIYTFDAEPDGQPHLTLTEDDLLLEEGDNGLVADLEGMTLYYKDNGQGFLFISSQGNYTYGVFNRTPLGVANTFLRAFAVVDDTFGIDGVQETDSIDVTNIPLGPVFPHGAFIVQDGMDTTADPNDTDTNFKWLKWEDIAADLGEETFSSSYNPRVSTNRRIE